MAWDYIIVGAGSAGCALAHRLSAKPGNKVLVLEGGGNDTSPLVRIPAGEIKAILNPRFNWMYMSEADPSLNGRDAMWPGGKVLGGSSSINGMIYLRGQPRGLRRLGPPDRQHRRVELPGRAALLQAHGEQPARAKRVSRRQRPARGLRRADAASAGPRLLRRREGDRHPPSIRTSTASVRRAPAPTRGRCVSAAATARPAHFLRPVMDRPNLSVETEAKVDKVVFEEGPARAPSSTAGAAREARGHGGRRKLSFPPAPSPRRRSCCAQGSGRGTISPNSASPWSRSRRGSATTCRSIRRPGWPAMSTFSTYNTEVTPSGWVRPRPQLAAARQGAGREPHRPGGGFRLAPGRKRKSGPTSRSTSSRPVTTSARTASSCWTARPSPCR